MIHTNSLLQKLRERVPAASFCLRFAVRNVREKSDDLCYTGFKRFEYNVGKEVFYENSIKKGSGGTL